MLIAISINRLAVHKLHHKVGKAVRGRAAVQQAGDVGMIQRGNRPSLTIEAFQRRWIFRFCGRKYFDGGSAAHEFMLAQIDIAHAPRAKLLHDLIFADREAPPTALKELLGLEMGEDSVTD